MPRTARIVAPATTYHLVSRGTGGEAVFRSDLDRRRFLGLLELVVTRHRWNCLAYCLMGTHYHLVVETPTTDLDRGMHRLNGCYAQSFNKRHGRFGHLFAERFQSVRVARDGHLLEVIRYVAMNPVRAALCASPHEWEWSSYRSALGLVPPAIFLAVDRLLPLFGRDPRSARQRLRAFVEEK